MRKINDIVLVGRDTGLWLAALGMLRAVGALGVNIHVIELPCTIKSGDVLATLPSMVGLHRLLGIDESAVLRETSGTYVMAQRFANFARSKAPFLVPYDTQGVPLRNVDFVQYWLRARAEGLQVALEEFSIGAVAAKNARFVAMDDTTAAFSSASYGYHLNAQPYYRALQRQAVKLGAKALAVDRLGVDIDGDRITGLRLADGRIISGDLFIDVSGEEGALISLLSGGDWTSWDHYFPTNRLLGLTARPLEPLPGFSHIAAHRFGWLGLFPTQTRTGVVVAFDQSLIDDDDMLQTAKVLAGVPIISDEAYAADLRHGLRERAWIGNCVALGDAAFTCDPIDSAGLQSLHVTLSHLVSLFPLDADHMPEATRFNRNVAAHAANIRDFQIAHFKLNHRVDEPLWDKARRMQIPDTLAYKIAAFEARGLVPIYDYESFQRESWLAMFAGHGLAPHSYDPLADAMPQAELIQQFQSMLKYIADEVKGMPTLAAQIELNAAPRGFNFF